MIEPDGVIGSDIVIHGDQLPAKPMDSVVNLLADDVECAAMIKWWQARRAMVRQQLADALGTSTSGTVNGQEVVTYNYINQFNTTEFKKKFPDMYQVYTRTVAKEELDVEKLKKSRPDLYQEFRVRTMLVSYEPPGKTPTNVQL